MSGNFTPTVTIKNGTLSGVYNAAYQQDFFLGVPYAAPPIGDRRFRRPEPSLPWEGVRSAVTYSNWCMGINMNIVGFSQDPTGPMSEDCLYINIVRPTNTPPEAKLPVMAWIHGGAYLEGSANDPRYNGSFLVRNAEEMGTPIIFASLNYRLGTFGMLTGAAAEAQGASNLFLHDQRKALAWLQENVAAFGGDPARVTIFGESAGAMSIGMHLISYGGRNDGLYSAAILESGGPLTRTIKTTDADKEAPFTRVLAATGCDKTSDPMSCLRSAPASTLLSVQANSAAVDNDLITQSPATALARGDFVRVPIIAGTNRNEGTAVLSTYAKSPINSYTDFAPLITQLLPGTSPPEATQHRLWEAYQRYAASSGIDGPGSVVANQGSDGRGTAYGAATLFMGDAFFGFGRRATNRAWAAHGVPSYAYTFDAQTANLDPRLYGTAHFQEIPFVFGNDRGVGFEVNPIPPSDARYARLAKIMSEMWISFAVTHSPNNHHRMLFMTK